ncbi:LysR substrate-binding domain-containing protein [Sphingomonas sanguinis]|uniref:LysR substrate-binding domain-containing protein n=1 Tax=Sphingomonas sp. LC-1 TaxID=3110957 RepID=UPI0021BA400A|nr:LysR substrate-binding domain-containing protein [Sphingomonas sp. LC-1]MCT8001962.1 LysR substrate-binding domain-containing protein [Sphingomonas sp. LC-1]
MLQDLVSLRLFVRAAESGKLGEAARQGNLAIAAASRRIALLEAQFGVRLFDRSRSGLTLTPAGSALLVTARTLLEQARAIDDEMADFAGGMRGVVRLHTNPSAIIQFLPADLVSFATTRPDVRIDLEENMSAAIVEAVAANRADLGIIIGGTAQRELETMNYRRDKLALLSPRGMYGDRQSIEFSEVQDQDFVGLVGSTALTRTMLAEAAKADRALRLRVQVQSFDGVCRMVESGFGLGVLPEKAARAFARSMALDVVPLSDPWAIRQMEICLSPSVRSGSLARILAEHLTNFTDVLDEAFND